MTTATQKIPSGYKQTEIGVIPEDWDVKKLESVCTMKSGAGITNAKINQSAKYPCYGGNGLRGYTDYFTHNGFYALIGRQGALCGNVLGVHGKFFASEHAVVVSAGSSTDISWLTFVMKEMHLNQYSESSAQPGLSVEKILKLLIKVPSNKQEQAAIATTLSDTDALIEKLEKLIEKKKNIKQGAMQELLTGKRRLPGFSGKWEMKRLGELCNIAKGIQRGRAKLSETGKYPVWNGGIEPSGYLDDWNANENTITISEGGNSCGFVNYCTEKFWLGGHCYAIQDIKDNIKIDFLFQLLKYRETKIMSMRVGSGLPNIQKKNLLTLEVCCPSNESEQITIATILSDMDTEIEKLESQLTKYQNFKQGMMQTLLTGKIRLLTK